MIEGGLMKPIIFSTEMVRKILSGNKTQMRRVVKTKCGTPVGVHIPSLGYAFDGLIVGDINDNENNPFGLMTGVGISRPPYLPGEVLWIREIWRHCMDKFEGAYIGGYSYKADCLIDAENDKYDPWRSARYMPREAARLFLRVTNVRLQRLQNISREDANAEGSYLDRCECLPRKNDRKPFEIMFQQTSCYIHGEEFKALWDRLNAKKGFSWESNCWVWVIEFERIHELEVERSENK